MRVTSSVTIDESELEVQATTSRGPGGQHVNRSETRVLLRWNVLDSTSVTQSQRARILERLASRISREGVLQVAAEDHRSRTRNLELARQRLAEFLAAALHSDPPRKATKPTKAARKRRVDDKKKRGDIKQSRRKPRSDD